MLSQNIFGTDVSANAAGEKTFFGGSGDNLIEVTAAPTHVDGGGGLDTLEIAGSMTLAAGSIVSIETIEVDDGVNANLSGLTEPYSIALLSITGGGSTVTGTRSADTIVGGLGNDLIAGGLGSDTLSGSGGGNRFLYRAIAEIGAGQRQLGPHHRLQGGRRHAARHDRSLQDRRRHDDTGSDQAGQCIGDTAGEGPERKLHRLVSVRQRDDLDRRRELDRQSRRLGDRARRRDGERAQHHGRCQLHRRSASAARKHGVVRAIHGAGFGQDERVRGKRD